MYTAMVAGNQEQMARYYEREFNQLSNNYYKQAAWPEADAIKSLVDDDEHFLTLYKQIYYKHYMSKMQPTMEHNLASWENYIAIFDGILAGTLDVEVLPPDWAYGIVAEFVYQYQGFSQYRAKVSSKSEAEIETFKQYQNIWNTPVVFSYLQQLISKSDIVSKIKLGEDLSKANAVTQLGYFSLISLSRAMVLIGDYYTALDLLSPINFSKKGNLYTKSPMCNVSLYYHMGFAQMMLQHFADAVQTFSTIALQVNRNRQYFSRLADAEQIKKLSDKSVALLSICMSFTPGVRVDDQVHRLIRDKIADLDAKLQRGEKSAYGELFLYSCPKFILPTTTIATNQANQAVNLQITLFSEMVKRYEYIPTARSYLKLYRTIDVAKLARFRNVDEDAMRCELVALKYNYDRSSKDSDYAVSTSDIDFYLNNDLVVIDEPKPEHRSGKFFIHQIHKFQRIVDDCQAGKP